MKGRERRKKCSEGRGEGREREATRQRKGSEFITKLPFGGLLCLSTKS